MNQEQRDQEIRYAVVGLGHLAQVAVLPAFKNAPNSELVTIVSGDAEKRKKLGKKYRLDKAYSYDEYEKALAEVDAVYLVLPNHLHRDYAVRAAEAGVHVLCEKPMATDRGRVPRNDRSCRSTRSEVDDRLPPAF